MAEEQDQEDKTEAPTARRLEKAKEEGQVLRSQDATTAAVTLGVISLIYLSGAWLGEGFTAVFKSSLIFDGDFREPVQPLLAQFSGVLAKSFILLTPLFLFALLVVIGTASGIGGLIFSLKAAAPKLSKINPLKGLARIFGLRALVELTKAILKFSLVAVFASIFLYLTLDYFLYLGWGDTNEAITRSLDLVFLGASITCLALIVIAAVDIPYQRFDFIKKLKMSKKDVKDELKEMEGQPEVRQQIRRKQRELAEQRMLDEDPNADVVITNPSHFAVALIYDVDSEMAPRVVAKGQDFMAQRIKERARESEVLIFEAPPLARALYFSVDVGVCIPEALFHSVAQVIAYVYGLNASNLRSEKPKKPKPKVPRELDFDSDGNKRSYEN